MDVYQKVLVKLHEVTGGKDTQTVDFKELVKGLGFLGSYPDIFKQMSRSGFIAESRRPDTVSITHWGIKEVKKISQGTDEISDSAKIVEKETSRLQGDLKQFVIMINEFANESTKGNFENADKVFGQINDAFGKIKANLE